MKQHNRLLLILVLGGVLAVLAHLYGPAAAQRRGMRAAAEYRRQIEPAVTADPRFSDLIIGVSTHPALYVQGTVPDTRSLDDLKRLLIVPNDADFRLILNVSVAPMTRPAD